MQRCADFRVGYSQISIPSLDNYPVESGKRFFSHALRLNQYNPMELGIEVDASEDPRIQGGVGRAGIRRPMRPRLAPDSVLFLIAIEP